MAGRGVGLVIPRYWVQLGPHVANNNALLHRVLLQHLASHREILPHSKMLERNGVELQYRHGAKWVQEETTSLRLGLARLG